MKPNPNSAPTAAPPLLPDPSAPFTVNALAPGKLEEMEPRPPVPSPRFVYWDSIDPASHSPYPLD
ncbi:hypothetical protein [Hymenobacter sp. B81]|uniref:hypothetical protein n=1 Tax=Hymenobacter sp. B81 TaxID=3344878 RepID=UPI0037DDA376